MSQQKCTCTEKKQCDLCKSLVIEALSLAQWAGPAGAMEQFYKHLYRLRREHGLEEVENV